MLTFALYNSVNFEPQKFLENFRQQHLAEESYLIGEEVNSDFISAINFEKYIKTYKIYYTYNEEKLVCSAEISDIPIKMWLDGFNIFYNFTPEFQKKIFYTFSYKVFANCYSNESSLFPECTLI